MIGEIEPKAAIVKAMSRRARRAGRRGENQPRRRMFIILPLSRDRHSDVGDFGSGSASDDGVASAAGGFSAGADLARTAGAAAFGAPPPPPPPPLPPALPPARRAALFRPAPRNSPSRWCWAVLDVARFVRGRMR